jgi:hypothetical protein
MKTMRYLISCLGVMILLLTAGVVGSGCSSTQSASSKGAYPTLKDTQRNVEWPMTNYRNAVAAGGITQGEQQRVNADYAKYQAAYASALQAAGSNENATTPENVKNLANQVITDVSGSM